MTHRVLTYLSQAWPLVVLCLVVWLLWGCRRGESLTPPLIIAGSTSVQPFAEKLAEVYMQRHHQVCINVQGGGSSAGIYAARHGAAHLGASSRELAASERDLHQIPIAWDGIAIIVHPSNPLQNLTVEELRQIFSGRLTDWLELDVISHAIHVISREEGSGTRDTFEHILMGKEEVTPRALVQDSNGAVRELVASDPYAIGYISVGLVDERVKAVPIDGVAPCAENIKSRRYKLARRFLLVSMASPSGLCQSFVQFILSPEGQRLLEKEGLVAIK